MEVGSRYTDQEWSQTLLTLNQFIDRYITRKVNVTLKKVNAPKFRVIMCLFFFNCTVV